MHCAQIGSVACSSRSRSMSRPARSLGPVTLDLDPDVIYAALGLGPDEARIYVPAPSIAA
jgi:hypothetical protein